MAASQFVLSAAQMWTKSNVIAAPRIYPHILPDVAGWLKAAQRGCSFFAIFLMRCFVRVGA
jgi:hypothetical protein